jgi:hypothetical protein
MATSTSSALLRLSRSRSRGSRVLLAQGGCRSISSRNRAVAIERWQEHHLNLFSRSLSTSTSSTSSTYSSTSSTSSTSSISISSSNYLKNCRFFATNGAAASEAEDSSINDLDTTPSSTSSGGAPHKAAAPRSKALSYHKSAPLISLEQLDPSRVMEDVVLASQVNQGNKGSSSNKRKGLMSAWDPTFCRQAVASYGQHLKYMATTATATSNNNNNNEETDGGTTNTLMMSELVSSEITCRAIRALLRCNLPTTQLSQRVRELERLIGTIGKTMLTEELSLHLLQANGLAGNVGRTLALLQLRKSRNYVPHVKEFTWAVQAITSAALEMRTNRNVYKSEGDMSSSNSSSNATSSNASLDNPTRFLDAILINMHQRGVALDMKLATTMLETYASTGRTGKALHFHYKVSLPYDEASQQQQQQQQQHAPSGIDEGDTATSISRRRRRSVRLKWNAPAPYYKIPSEISNDQLLALPGSNERRTKSDHELTDSWSLPLTAAFAFCDSLAHGACGHDALALDLPAYNAMIKVCCYRGALWRAMDILHKTIPDAELEANTISYLRVLEALARVGDTKMMSLLFTEMVQKDATLLLNRQVIAAMVNGMLNTGNIAGAISFIQDVFNQYNILPPYTTHLKLLEMALASTDNKTTEPYEAKRHVYFLQQLWRWEPNPYHSKSLRNQVATTKGHIKLSKQALQDMFAYFGHELTEEDFFDEFQETGEVEDEL